MKTYNVGFLGFGFMGKTHTYGYFTLPLFYSPAPCSARITHICTSRIETAEAAKEQVGARVAITDFREITENPDVDIVHICTPNSLHKEELLPAIRHNKHIYCDKPLVATMGEAEEIRSALESYSGTAQMTFQYRFFPATMRARQLVDEGFLGELLEFRAAFLHAGSADPDAPLKWKLSAESGGGVIADLASHVLDLLSHLVGGFAALNATTKIAYAERPSAGDASRRVKVDAEDCVMMLARTKSGALGFIEATKLATGTEDELWFELHGSRGAIRFNSMDPHHLHVYDARAAGDPIGGVRGWTAVDTGQRYPKPASGLPPAKCSMGWIRAHAACLANFLQCIADGKKAEPGLEQGIHVQHLMDCAKRSAEQGTWIEV